MTRDLGNKINNAEYVLTLAEIELNRANTARDMALFNRRFGDMLGKRADDPMTLAEADTEVSSAQKAVEEAEAALAALRAEEARQREEKYLESVAEARSAAAQSGFVAGPASRWLHVRVEENGPVASIMVGHDERESIPLTAEDLRNFRAWLDEQGID